MSEPSVEFEFVTRVLEEGEGGGEGCVPAEELVALYRAAGWWKTGLDERGTLGALVRGSFCFLVARQPGGPALAMGRAISDGVSDGYLQDVTVAPAWRQKGIGRELVRRLTERCRERGLTWIGLVAEPGTTAFYQALGFRPFPGQPMLHRGTTRRQEPPTR